MKVENSEAFRRNLHKMWNADKYCDIILIGGDGNTRIPAHRLVLEAASPYFIIQPDAGDANMKEIAIAAIDGATLKLLVSACYSGLLEVDENNVSSAYMGAVHLQLDAILTTLDSNIMAHLNDFNCLHFHKLAETFSRSVLYEATEKYICTHFIQISDGPAFLNLDATYLKKLLALEQLQVPSAEDLFRKVIKWIQHDPEGLRADALPALLPKLRLPFMSPQFLLEHVNPLCQTTDSKNLVITAALQNRLEFAPSVPIDVGPVKNETSPASAHFGLERLIVVTKGEAEGKEEILEYSFQRRKWNTLYVLSTGVIDYAIAHSMALDSLCFVGGDCNGSEVSDVLLWNLRTHKFTKVTEMLNPRSNAGVTFLNDGNDTNGDLIVVGGYQDKKPISTVERWSRKSDKWHSLDSMKQIRYYARLITMGNLIYCIGGMNNYGNFIKSVDCYDLAKNCWLTLAPLHYRRVNHAVVNDGGKLYVIGGFSDVIECYNPKKNEWTEVCKVEGSEAVTTCVRYNNRFFAFGKNIVFTSDGDWKTWKQSDTIKATDKIFVGAFSVQLQ